MNGVNYGQAAPPWTLWGQTQKIEVNPTLLAIQPVQENNTTLCRAAYGRPETWRWLLAFQILSGGTPSGAGETALVEVVFELISGVGRSALRLPEFMVMQLDWSNGNPVRTNQLVYATSAPAFSSIPWPAADPVPRIETFVSQDITIVAKAAYLTDVPGAVAPVQIEVTGQLAPNTHVRPDWMQIDANPAAQFPGGEIGGR